MSKGTKVIGVRLPAVVREMVEEELADRANDPLQSEWTMTTFITQAVLEKLHHYARNRRNDAYAKKVMNLIRLYS